MHGAEMSLGLHAHIRGSLSPASSMCPSSQGFLSWCFDWKAGAFSFLVFAHVPHGWVHLGDKAARKKKEKEKVTSILPASLFEPQGPPFQVPLVRESCFLRILSTCMAGDSLHALDCRGRLLVLWPEREEFSWNLFCPHLLHGFGI